MKQSDQWPPLYFTIPVIVAMFLILVVLFALIGFDPWHSLLNTSAIFVLVACGVYLWVDRKPDQEGDLE